LTIKDGDFVRVDYVGRVDGKIFDLTEESVAKKENIYNEKVKYGSVVIIVGAGHLLKGIDEALVGKKVGDKFTVDVPPEKAFGKKNAKLIKIIPEKSFREQDVRPHPGMQVNIDGLVGNIISSGGGRVIVDFNHPLASKILNYEISILKKIEEPSEQLKSITEIYTNMKQEKIHVEIAENNAKITIENADKLDNHIKEHIEEEAKKYIKLNKVEFVSSISKEAVHEAKEHKKTEEPGMAPKVPKSKNVE
jgi:FKBP-type peptidyl-prolyl cis-trans isomerase SlyD